MACNGCDYADTCLGVGTRVIDEVTTIPYYCGFDKTLIEQKGIGADCINNFECSDYVCLDRKCEDVGFWKNLAKSIARIFGLGEDELATSEETSATDTSESGSGVEAEQCSDYYLKVGESINLEAVFIGDEAYWLTLDNVGDSSIQLNVSSSEGGVSIGEVNRYFLWEDDNPLELDADCYVALKKAYPVVDIAESSAKITYCC